MKVKEKRLDKAISMVFLLVICIFQPNLPGYTGGPLCFLDEMFGGCVGSCSDTPKCQEKLLNKDKVISNTETARRYIVKSLCVVDENYGNCVGECSSTPKCQEKLKKAEQKALEKRRQTIAVSIDKQRQIKSNGEIRIASAQDRAMKEIEAEEIAQTRKKAQEESKMAVSPYGGLNGLGTGEEGQNLVTNEKKEKAKSGVTYQDCVNGQGGKLSCAGRLGTPPEILAMANEALMKMADKASYCEKRKGGKACQTRLIAIKNRIQELQAKESIVASNNL